MAATGMATAGERIDRKPDAQVRTDRAPRIEPRTGALELKLSHHLALKYSERDALRSLEGQERRVAAGEILYLEGDRTDRLQIVASGWLHGSTVIDGGARQILRFYFVGDVAGEGPAAWGRASSTLTAVSGCRLYEVERAMLGRMFRDHPRLACLFYAVAMTEQAAMAQRLTSVGRTDAVCRIGTLLLELRDQLEVVDGDSGSMFELPLTLQDLGDATGLTKTHAGRVLRRLEEDGFLERDGRVLRILDVARFAALVGYRERVGRVLTDWMV